ncbi:MAG: SIMPL domain-containing protein [Acidobacteria bacterium]|nr:SIMPL domain-containing protein [Acidobacteriota bacterium]
MKIAVMLLVWSCGALAQTTGNDFRENSVHVSAQGTFEAAPDTAVVHFAVSAQEKSARAAYDHASRAMDQVREMLRAAGTEPAAAEFGSFQLHPVYDDRGPKQKITGYSVASNVVLKLKDFAKAGAILDQVTNLDAAEDISLSYIVSDAEAAKRHAVEAAMERARAEAEAAARTGGRSLGDLVYVWVDMNERIPASPAPGAFMLDAGKNQTGARVNAPSDEFSPRTVSITATVSALFGLK